VSGGADIFAGLAPLLRVRPELQTLCNFGAKWAAPHDLEETGWAPFHVVTFGECQLDTYDRPGIVLKRGDIAVLPHGDRHIVKAQAAFTEPGGPIVSRSLANGLTLKSNVTGDADTQLICGRFRFEQAQGNMVLAALPTVVVVEDENGPQAARIRRLVTAMREELDEDGAGSVAVAADLATAIITIVLRVHFEKTQASAGVIALLANRQTGRALAAMLADPKRDWTLDELAAEAAASRATLVRLFQKMGGSAPLAFLSELRLSLAHRRLVASRDTLAEIADAVGYQSESAFSRAYRNRFGLAPGAARKAAI
jgi:AraC family transcriptional regulator, activator of mtrCDE